MCARSVREAGWTRESLIVTPIRWDLVAHPLSCTPRGSGLGCPVEPRGVQESVTRSAPRDFSLPPPHVPFPCFLLPLSSVPLSCPPVPRVLPSCPALVSVSLSLSLSPHFLSCSLRCCCTDSPLPLSSILPAPSLLLSSQSLSVARTRDTPAPHLSPDLLCHGSLPRLPSPHAAAAAPGRQPLLVPCCLRQPGLRCCEYPAFLPSCS